MFWAGSQIARHGDTIAIRTGLGGGLIGAGLVASVTSLPELTTDVFAVLEGAPSLATGDLFGSSMANMAILAVVGLSAGRARVLRRVAINQALVGALAVALTATACAGIVAEPELAVGGIGWAPVAVAVGYLVGVRVLHVNRTGSLFMTAHEEAGARRALESGRTAATGFVVAAAVVVVASYFLATSAADVADELGITAGFMGVALLAAVTSLPELVVSFTGVRRGAHDLAVGNLLGSNAFNMVILLFLDVADGSASLLASVDPAVLTGAMFSLLLMGEVLLELLNRAEQRERALQPGLLLVLATYGFGIYAVSGVIERGYCKASTGGRDRPTHQCPAGDSQPAALRAGPGADPNHVRAERRGNGLTPTDSARLRLRAALQHALDG